MVYSNKLTFTGVQVNYYFVCKRELWFYSKNLEMEHSSDTVFLGKLLHETSYIKKFKEIGLGGIKIDFLEKDCEIHETKKSRKIEKAHIYQLLYYLYYLKQLGIYGKGVINYPLLRRKVDVKLTENKEEEIVKILVKVKEILSSEKPPELERKSYCRKCSYYQLCWC